MRLLIVGTLKGQLTTATKIAMDRGASVTHAESIEQALAVLREAIASGYHLVHKPMQPMALRAMLIRILQSRGAGDDKEAKGSSARPTRRSRAIPSRALRP